MRLWRRKLKSMFGGFMLAASLLHNTAGGPMLNELPRPAEPVVGKDYEREQPDHRPEPPTTRILVYTTSSSPTGYTGRFDGLGMDL